jgi:hypothetical protein
MFSTQTGKLVYKLYALTPEEIAIEYRIAG